MVHAEPGKQVPSQAGSWVGSANGWAAGNRTDRKSRPRMARMGQTDGLSDGEDGSIRNHNDGKVWYLPWTLGVMMGHPRL